MFPHMYISKHRNQFFVLKLAIKDDPFPCSFKKILFFHMEKCQEQVPQFSSHKDSDMLGCPQSWHKWTEEPNVHDVFPTSHLYPNYEPPPTPEYLAWSWLKPSTQQNTHKLSTTKSLQPLVMARRGELAFKISSNNTMGAITHFYSLPLWNKYLKETGRRTIRAIKYLCSTVYWAFSCL